MLSATSPYQWCWCKTLPHSCQGHVLPGRWWTVQSQTESRCSFLSKSTTKRRCAARPHQSFAKVHCKVPLRRVEVKSFTLPRGNLSWTKESVFLGQLPKRLIVGFVDNDAYNGSSEKNLQFQALQHELPFVGEGRGTDLFKSVATGLWQQKFRAKLLVAFHWN